MVVPLDKHESSASFCCCPAINTTRYRLWSLSSESPQSQLLQLRPAFSGAGQFLILRIPTWRATPAHLLIFAFQLAVCRAVVCPQHYKEVLGVCVKHTSIWFKMPYCEAQTWCTSLDGELARGSTVMALNGKTFPNMPYSYWIGMTDWEDERRRSREN